MQENFEPLGEVTSKGVYEKEFKDEKRFFAFLAYSEESSAKQAIEKFNNHKFEDEENPLYVGIAQSKRARVT